MDVRGMGKAEVEVEGSTETCSDEIRLLVDVDKGKSTIKATVKTRVAWAFLGRDPIGCGRFLLLSEELSAYDKQQARLIQTSNSTSARFRF